jgi:hypothetical protein
VVDTEALKAAPPDGICPVLAKFAPVPKGATMLALIPFVPKPVAVTENWFYLWRIVFRTRSAGDYLRRPDLGRAYGIGVARHGAADSRTLLVPGRGTLTLAGERFVLPSVSEGQVYQRAEPDMGSLTGPMSSVLLTDGAKVPTHLSALASSPIYPGAGALNPAVYATALEYQQGVFDPDFPGVTGEVNTFNPVTATHFPKWLKSLGTEFAIECYKFNYEVADDVQTYTARTWDFLNLAGTAVSPTSEDYGFSVMFGVGAEVANKAAPEDTGVRVYTGTAPE